MRIKSFLKPSLSWVRFALSGKGSELPATRLLLLIWGVEVNDLSAVPALGILAVLLHGYTIKTMPKIDTNFSLSPVQSHSFT